MRFDGDGKTFDLEEVWFYCRMPLASLLFHFMQEKVSLRIFHYGCPFNGKISDQIQIYIVNIIVRQSTWEYFPLPF